MQNLGAELLSELKRVVECPYPASLTKLAGLLKRADALVIRACIRNLSLCAVNRLAAVVSEALPLWAYTLQILSILCQSVEFTNTILSQTPDLLDALLTKANSSESDFNEHAALCVILLSNPLPDAVPLPASAQPFFFKVFQKAVKEPIRSTFKPVYCMLNGACRELTGFLSPELRRSFDEELYRILTSKDSKHDFTLLPWCFGIVLLANYPDSTGLSQHLSQEHINSPAKVDKQCRTSAGGLLFGDSDRKTKNLTLTCLNVIWAIKGNVGIPEEEAIETIHIAIRTLQLIEPDTRKAWPKSSHLAANTFPKFPSKILRADINPYVQLKALSFYAMIVGPNCLPSEFVAQYQQCLLRIPDLGYTEGLEEILVVSLPLYCPQLHQSFIQSWLVQVMNSCISPQSEHQLLHYIILVRSIKTILVSCKDAQRQFLSAVLSKMVQPKVKQLLRVSIDDPTGTCCSSSALLHSQMVSGTIAMLLTLAVTTEATALALPLTLTTSLIDKQGSLPALTRKCVHATAVPKHLAISLFEQNNTPYTGQNLQDWRGRLRSELESQNNYQTDSVIRSVVQVCQELETRCNTVEEPLRLEKEKSQDMERQVKELKDEITFLQSQATDCRFQLDGLEDERDGLAAKLEELQIEFEKSNDEANKSLKVAEDTSKAMEADLRSIIISHEEDLRVRDDTIEEKDCTIAKLKCDLDEMYSHSVVLEKKCEELQQAVEDAEERLVVEKENTRAQSDKIPPLDERIHHLEIELSTTKMTLEATTTQFRESQAKHQDSILLSEEAYRAQENKFKQEMEAVTITAETEKKKLQEQLDETMQSSRYTKSAYEAARTELRLLQASVPAFETKVHELTDLCSRQKEELDDLITWRKNVLASMGVESQQPLAIRPAYGTRKDTVVAYSRQKPREHRRHKPVIQPRNSTPNTLEDLHDTVDPVMENCFDASFVSSGSNTSQNGRSPKRSKHQPPSKMPSMHTPSVQKTTKPSGSVSMQVPTERMALQQMSSNRRHSTNGFTTHPNEANLDKQDIDEPSDFDISESQVLWTSLTPNNFISGTGRLYEAEVDDDMTTEL